jgi:hypothetical protein
MILTLPEASSAPGHSRDGLVAARPAACPDRRPQGTGCGVRGRG